MPVLRLLAIALLLASPAAAAQGLTDCTLRYDLSGWSVFYKTASGHGTVTCSNGQRMSVRIRTKGGGLTVGKGRIVGGTGEFSGVRSIEDVLGTCVSAEAHAGAVRSGRVHVMAKDDVALALAGKGRGWDLGVAFGTFVIER